VLVSGSLSPTVPASPTIPSGSTGAARAIPTIAARAMVEIVALILPY
jgi:hypothetical protein